jgi:hypothetical protein
MTAVFWSLIGTLQHVAITSEWRKKREQAGSACGGFAGNPRIAVQEKGRDNSSFRVCLQVYSQRF